jgi:hypothetical protein
MRTSVSLVFEFCLHTSLPFRAFAFALVCHS